MIVTLPIGAHAASRTIKPFPWSPPSPPAPVQTLPSHNGGFNCYFSKCGLNHRGLFSFYNDNRCIFPQAFLSRVITEKYVLHSASPLPAVKNNSKFWTEYKSYWALFCSAPEYFYFLCSLVSERRDAVQRSPPAHALNIKYHRSFISGNGENISSKCMDGLGHNEMSTVDGLTRVGPLIVLIYLGIHIAHTTTEILVWKYAQQCYLKASSYSGGYGLFYFYFWCGYMVLWHAYTNSSRYPH